MTAKHCDVKSTPRALSTRSRPNPLLSLKGRWASEGGLGTTPDLEKVHRSERRACPRLGGARASAHRTKVHGQEGGLAPLPTIGKVHRSGRWACPAGLTHWQAHRSGRWACPRWPDHRQVHRSGRWACPRSVSYRFTSFEVLILLRLPCLNDSADGIIPPWLANGPIAIYPVRCII